MITPPVSSPFHKGERDMQTLAGKRQSAEQIGQRAIRSFMPDQHRAFFEKLPFVLVGSVDRDGWPWASMLSGGSQFITSPDDKRLDIDAHPLTDDPLITHLRPGSPLGILGIELSTRRRNRMNATVRALGTDGLSLDVVQSFGNCPQYIQTHDLHPVRDASTPVTRAPADRFTDLDAAAQAFIAQASSFYVASAAKSGADVSHRGGQHGFLRVAGNTILVPDFAGNNFFNTLGNFLQNPKAGLLFPDYSTGDLLMLTGTTELLPPDHPEIAGFIGANRGWRFTLDHGLRIYDGMPFRADFTAWSPQTLATGTWDMPLWRDLRVTAIKDESTIIRSFTLAPVDGRPLPDHKAGQFITLKATPVGGAPQIRNYTVSSSPQDDALRISVKRENNGVMSNHLHDAVQVGDIIATKSPAGLFHFDATAKRPAALFAGGVGVTPMIAMARAAIQTPDYIRPLSIFHAARTTDQRAFADDFRKIAAQSLGQITYLSLISTPAADDVQRVDYDIHGRITADLIKSNLPLDDYDFYICGSGPFMQTVYDALRALGARDDRIFAESFGPETLQRDAMTAMDAPVTDSTTVVFAKSQDKTQSANYGESLLETAEAHGIDVPFSCRNGSCGSCATRKISGSIEYRSPVTADHSADDILLCCAIPAKDAETIILDL